MPPVPPHACHPTPPLVLLQSPAAPAGLRNLGNTCYVNAAMQFLHSLPDFRNALYKLEPELAEQQIVKQMRCAAAGSKQQAAAHHTRPTHTLLSSTYHAHTQHTRNQLQRGAECFLPCFPHQKPTHSA